jgi:hypothetical protein
LPLLEDGEEEASTPTAVTNQTAEKPEMFRSQFFSAAAQGVGVDAIIEAASADELVLVGEPELDNDWVNIELDSKSSATTAQAASGSNAVESATRSWRLW